MTRREQIAEMAEREFKDHVLTPVEGQAFTWKCAKPGTWIIGFYVSVIADSRIVITGDVGDMVLVVYNHALTWFTKDWHPIHCNYFMEKVSRSGESDSGRAWRTFDRQIADSFLADLRGDDESYADPALADRIEEEWDGQENLESWDRACHDAGVDFEDGSAAEWSDRALWLYQAARTFSRLYREQEAK